MSSRTPGRGLKRMMGSQQAPCDPVEVFSRVKPAPMTAPDFDDCLVIRDDRTLVLERAASFRSTEYSFTRIFDDASKQSEIFASVGLPLVEELVQGRNGLLFTYGVTGSGKSFTMHGYPDNPGLLPRCLDALFNSVAPRLAKKFVIRSDRANGFEVHTEVNAMLERQKSEMSQRQTQQQLYQQIGLTKQQLEAEVASRDRETARVALGDLSDDAYGCAVFVSYVEIYNKLVYDLLDEPASSGVINREPVSRALREDARRNVYVSGAAEVECRSADEAYGLFLKGRARRKVAQTALNAESSRSHSVFTVRLVRGCYDCRLDEMVQDKSLLAVSQLCLVDLAGSERTVRTGNAGSRLREASNINNSLLVLKRCMEVLRENQRAGANAPTKMVPYRDSKMTQLFKNYFDGDGSVKMVLCVNRNAEEAEETANVLKFAEMAMEVQVTRSKTPATPRWQPSAAVSRPQATAPPSAESAASSETGDSGSGGVCGSDHHRLWHFDTIKPVSPLSVSPGIQQPDPRIALMDSQWSLWEQRARLLRSELDSAWPEEPAGGQQDAVEELERVLAAHKVEKARLEKRLRHAEMRQCKEKAAADTERRELAARLEEQENLLRRERADKERLRDQFRYRMDTAAAAASAAATATPAAPPGRAAAASRAAMRRSRSQEQLQNTAATAAAASGAPTPGLVSRLRTRFSPGSGVQQHQQQQQQQAAPPQLAPPPPSNPRYHRRSRSAGQLIVDHRSRNETPSGTVMCPKVTGKRKSVTRLDARDIHKATDYMLTHQTSGPDGGLRTEVYKATVTPTAGGGSAVRFNDVERLEQVSPSQLRDTSWLTSGAATTGRKRKASGVIGGGPSSLSRKQRSPLNPLQLDSPEDVTSLTTSPADSDDD